MLADLKIENFAIADDIEINLHQGFNVLTGESGAGKSVIVESLNFVLGDRVKSAKISSEKPVRVQARFELGDNKEEIIEHLIQQGILEDDAKVLILTRKLYPSGRNIYHINGEMVPFRLYRSVGQSLVDIHGQRDSLFLLDADNQRKMLDQMGGKVSEDLLLNLKKLNSRFRELESEISRLKARELERNRQIDWLEHEIQEIESANLEPDEEEKLEREKLILENSEKIVESSSFIYGALSGERGVTDKLGSVSHELDRWIRFDPEMERVAVILEGVMEQVQEISYICMEKGENVEFNQEALDNIHQRQYLIEKLKRKYGVTIEDILNYLYKSREDLESLQKTSTLIETLSREMEEVKSQWMEFALRMSDLRKKLAVSLEEAITEELSSLGMESAMFRVMTENSGENSPGNGEDSNISANGMDKIEFLFGPNPGVPPKPLSLIASGGELSRVMLAFRSIFSDKWNFASLVLDEIDMGLGGVSAGVVGKKLKQISSGRQIICITHLPIIASLGDRHFVVEKIVEDGNTRTTLTLTKGTGRVEEVMRMLSGEKSPGETRKLAKKLLEGK